MELLKLVGILVVVIGFVLKFDTMATVVVAGLVTGLVAGMSPMEILETLGSSFISNRTATLFVLTLSAIGLCERNGLKDKAVDLINTTMFAGIRPEINYSKVIFNGIQIKIFIKDCRTRNIFSDTSYSSS